MSAAAREIDFEAWEAERMVEQIESIYRRLIRSASTLPVSRVTQLH
jgi:hypothetical protein